MRISLVIMEATALLHSVELSETALYTRLKKARSHNDVNNISDASMQLADLLFAKKKLEEALASETKTSQVKEK